MPRLGRVAVLMKLFAQIDYDESAIVEAATNEMMLMLLNFPFCFHFFSLFSFSFIL